MHRQSKLSRSNLCSVIVDTLGSSATTHSMKLHTVRHPTRHWPQRIEMREGLHHVNMLARLRSTQNAIDRRSAPSKKTISFSLLLLLLSRFGLLILITRLRSTRLRRGRLFTQRRTHRYTKVLKILVRIDKILHQVSPRARAVRVGKFSEVTNSPPAEACTAQPSVTRSTKGT